MGIPAKRRMEILDEIARLGKQEMKTATSNGSEKPQGGSPITTSAQRRIAELMLELAGLDEVPSATLKHGQKRKRKRLEQSEIPARAGEMGSKQKAVVRVQMSNASPTLTHDRQGSP